LTRFDPDQSTYSDTNNRANQSGPGVTRPRGGPFPRRATIRATPSVPHCAPFSTAPYSPTASRSPPRPFSQKKKHGTFLSATSQKKYSVKLGYKYYNFTKLRSAATKKNILQHRKLCNATLKNYIVISETVVLQRRKNQP
jgi:hypothetical protein